MKKQKKEITSTQEEQTTIPIHKNIMQNNKISATKKDSNKQQQRKKQSTTVKKTIKKKDNIQIQFNQDNRQTEEIQEKYFEILGFEQSSAMQIVQSYATDYDVILSLATSDKHSDLKESLCMQEYGIIAKGTQCNINMFFDNIVSLFGDRLLQGNLIEFLIQKLTQKSLNICVAESCTGGILSSMLTSANGASQVYKGGITTYSIESKMNVLGVKNSLLQEFSVYSEECVKAMARGAINLFGADIAIATSGLATEDTSKNNFLKLPAGVVFICILIQGNMPYVISQNYLHTQNSLALNLAKNAEQQSRLHTIHDTPSSRTIVQYNASIESLRILLGLL
ncbi:CinA family protein [Helicobacter didelphidarum]|nr:CinA family protein [Helicobacter didelphidarum]